MAMVQSGGCLCGKIRYECAGEPEFSLLCHCRDCQRQSGSAFIAAARMPATGFRITQGEPRRYVSKSDTGNDVSRYFCGDCGGPLYIQVSTRPDMIGLRVTTLDDPNWFRPDANIFTKSAQPWDHLDPAVPAYPTYPEGRAYPTKKEP